MKVTLLGTGTPTNPHRFQSSVLIEIGESKLLFDAGRGAVHQLYQVGAAIQRINPVFITHHHFDHINDLFDVIISTAMRGRDFPLQIYGPPGTKRIVDALLNQVYAQDIRFRLEEDRAIHQAGGSWGERPEAISLVAVRDVGPGVVVETDAWRVMADEVRHGEFPGAPDFDWRALGYRIEAEGKVGAVSGDTVACPGIIRLAQEADLLIQCCHLPQSKVNTPVMRYLTQSILPSSGQVGKIAAAARAKRMALTHLSESITPENYAEILADVQRDYEGETMVGEDLMMIEV
jgi:ribonuclease Z